MLTCSFWYASSCTVGWMSNDATTSGYVSGYLKSSTISLVRNSRSLITCSVTNHHVSMEESSFSIEESSFSIEESSFLNKFTSRSIAAISL